MRNLLAPPVDILVSLHPSAHIVLTYVFVSQVLRRLCTGRQFSRVTEFGTEKRMYAPVTQDCPESPGELDEESITATF
jgi:hypothetical protein